MAKKPSVLNIGGQSKDIAIPPYYADHRHVLLDIDPKGKPDITADARDMGTLKAGEYDAIYCSHNLEHYHAHDVPRVLAGMHHVLAADGFAEIRVPDLDAVMRDYVARDLDIEATLYTSPAGPVTVRDVIYGYGPIIARSGQDFYAHKTGFTQASLARALTRAGFAHVLRRPGRLLELSVLAFKSAPTKEQIKLLSLQLPADLAALAQ